MPAAIRPVDGSTAKLETAPGRDGMKDGLSSPSRVTVVDAVGHDDFVVTEPGHRHHAVFEERVVPRHLITVGEAVRNEVAVGGADPNPVGHIGYGHRGHRPSVGDSLLISAGTSVTDLNSAVSVRGLSAKPVALAASRKARSDAAGSFWL